MNKSRAEAIVAQLLVSASGLQYGSVAMLAKLHEGRIVSVSFTRTEQTKEQDEKKDKDQ